MTDSCSSNKAASAPLGFLPMEKKTTWESGKREIRGGEEDEHTGSEAGDARTVLA